MENKPNHFKKPLLTKKFQWFIGKIQTVSFREIWVEISTRYEHPLVPFANSNDQDCNLRFTIRGCSIYKTPLNVYASIQILIDDFLSVVFEIDELKQQAIAKQVAFLPFMVNQISRYDVTNILLDNSKLVFNINWKLIQWHPVGKTQQKELKK